MEKSQCNPFFIYPTPLFRSQLQSFIPFFLLLKDNADAMIWRYALARITLTLSFKWNIINQQSIHSIIVFLHFQTNSCSETLSSPVCRTLSNVTRLRYSTAWEKMPQPQDHHRNRISIWLPALSPLLHSHLSFARTSHANVSYLVPGRINLFSSLLLHLMPRDVLLPGDASHTADH